MYTCIHIYIYIVILSNCFKHVASNMLIYTEFDTGPHKHMQNYNLKHKAHQQYHILFPKVLFQKNIFQTMIFIKIKVFCSFILPAFGGP